MSTAGLGVLLGCESLKNLLPVSFSLTKSAYQGTLALTCHRH